MRRSAIAILALCLVTTAAQAEIPQLDTFTIPDGNVVELNVSAVSLPPSLPGVCTVKASIGKVWFGAAFRAGQDLSLDVPCDGNRLIETAARLNGITPVNAEALRHSRRAVVRLDDEGRIMWGSNLTNYGQWGAVMGYRVLDGRMLPLTRS